MRLQPNGFVTKRLLGPGRPRDELRPERARGSRSEIAVDTTNARIAFTVPERARGSWSETAELVPSQISVVAYRRVTAAVFKNSPDEPIEWL